MQAAQTPTSKLSFVTPEKESSITTLLQEEDFKRIYSRELLMEKAADIEKTIAVKEHEREGYFLNRSENASAFLQKYLWTATQHVIFCIKATSRLCQYTKKNGHSRPDRN